MVYEDIELYPIGGDYAEDVVIVCTCKELLPWLSQEGKFTMVKNVYYADVDGTIISPTTVVLQHIHLHQGFAITANIDNEKEGPELIY